MRLVRLRDIATARAGDKGDTSNIAVILRDPRHYTAVCAQLTPERLRDTWPALFRGPVRRYLLDSLYALNFVCDHALEGGVNLSLNLDAHGKSFSFLILDLEILIDDQASNPPSA